MKYINVRITDEEHAWIKREAANQNVTIQTFVRRLIETGMSRKESWIRSYAPMPEESKLPEPPDRSGK